MNTQSFFRYPGGKTKLRKEISNILLDKASHDGMEYREPFFGGGSIGLQFFYRNTINNNIWINDKDIGISCLWTSVINYIDDFKYLINNFNPSVESFYQFKDTLTSLNEFPIKKEDIVSIGFQKLAIHQISYSGLGTKSGSPLGGKNQQSDYKIDCRWSPYYMCKKADMLNKMFSSLCIRENKCTNLDFSELIIDNSKKSLIYLDPPYYVKGNALYQHGFTKEDHLRLSLLLKNTSHDWVLSYDDCLEVREMYEWASIYSFDVKYSITSVKDEDGVRSSTKKAELLIFGKK